MEGMGAGSTQYAVGCREFALVAGEAEAGSIHGILYATKRSVGFLIVKDG